MLRRSPHSFDFPPRRAPSHRFATWSAAIGAVLAGAGALTADDAIARALPFALLAVLVSLFWFLARLGRASGEA